MSACGQTHKPYLADAPLVCVRTLDETGRHKGQHEAIEHVVPKVYTLLGRDEPAKPPFDRFWQWSDDGGASGTTAITEADLAICIECGGRYEARGTDFNPAVALLSPGAGDAAQTVNARGRCFRCSFWQRTATDHAAGWRREHGRMVRTVRLHDDAKGWYPAALYAWSTGSSGAFGDRKVRVTWDDGDTRGPASSLWMTGRIPWEFDHLFPANADIEWVK